MTVQKRIKMLKNDSEELQHKLHAIIGVNTMIAKNPMGKYLLKIFIKIILIRSEGSLNQHIKLKHPEVYDEYMITHYGTNYMNEKVKELKCSDNNGIYLIFNSLTC